MAAFHAKVIRELRTARGMSQQALADALGISNRAVSKWERGISLPSAQHIYCLAELFGVPMDRFYRDEVQEETPAPPSAPTGMCSLTALYKIGRGPSSSHTIGPELACTLFSAQYPQADRFTAVLYGSLAKTGRGHGTDAVIEKTFAPLPCRIEWNLTDTALPHPNTMRLVAYRGDEELGARWVYSVGGGDVVFDTLTRVPPVSVYPHATWGDIAAYCEAHGMRPWEYVIEHEYEGIEGYMHVVWQTMKDAIHAGLQAEGILPGGLDLQRKARTLYNSQHVDESAQTRENRMVCAYAFAVGEQNAAGETIVTAPTCGAAGVLPAVMYYQQKRGGYSDTEIVHALMTAGLVGNLIKHNASISGAECGCQAEVGSACAMAAAALGELFGLSEDKIEYAAEIAIEHHLGLTCDPICGLVQIPCIERNAVAAMRAINAVNLASFLWSTRKISLDSVIRTMKETGHDLRASYKETSEAGLAKIQLG